MRTRHLGGWSRGVVVVVGLAGSLGCTSAPLPVPPGGGLGLRPRVVVPAAVGNALDLGVIAASDVEKLLAPIRSASPVGFHYEWVTAPGMMMLAMPQGTVDQSVNWVNQINSLLPTTAKMSPVETDFAFCAREERQAANWPLPTAPSYAPLSIPLGNAGVVLEVERIRAQLADLTFLPDNLAGSTPALVLQNGDIASFNFNLELQALHADARVRNPPWPFSNPHSFSMDIASLRIGCVATITPAAPGSMPAGLEICGDQVLACSPGTTTVTVDDLTTTGLGGIPELFWALDKGDFEAFGAGVVHAGIQLHFDNWAVTSLGTTPSGAFVLRGQGTLQADGSSLCSPSTPARPAEPPTRGLITTRTSRGHGEFYSKDGWVKPFYIEAELSTDYHSSSKTLPLVTRQGLPVARDYAFDHLGTEFPPMRDFDVSIAQTRLNANVRKLDCWRKEARFEDVLVVPFPQLGAWQGKSLQFEELMEMRDRRIHLVSVEALEPDEFRHAMKLIRHDCGECLGWSRIRADLMDREDRPFGPPDTFPDRPLAPAPWRIEVYVEASPEALESWLKPFHQCAHDGGDKWREVEGQRIYSMPIVELHDTMFDSAGVESGSYHDIFSTGAHDSWSLEGEYLVGSRTYKVVHLLEACVRAPDACWESTLNSPPKGYVWVDAASSNTTVPRTALRAAMTGGTIPAYGSRNAAVQGYFDRSRVELVTAIPQVYVDNGVSAAGFDYRGGAMLDWRHGSSFLEPDPFRGDSEFRHVGSSFDEWLNPHAQDDQRRGSGYIAYRADWATDTLQVRRGASDGLSYCALLEQLSVELDMVGFSGAGLPKDVVVPANVVFPSSTLPVPLVSANWRWGWTWPALNP